MNSSGKSSIDGIFLKSVEEINDKIRDGEATVLSASEFKDRVRNNDVTGPEDVDVVTTATCGLMSGTAAILSVPVAERGEFERADQIWLNDVPAFPGPCPNERLGIVDLIVYGPTSSISDPYAYGGGHLLRDLVEGKDIQVRVDSDGETFENRVTLDDLGYARIFTTRSAFKNYMAFLNTQKDEVKSIFSVMGLEGPYKEISVSGCGEINPIENDPDLDAIGVGSKILLNGGIGYVVGEGTRSEPENPNLSVIADMKNMEPQFMGGFKTSEGPECITSLAVPIPVLDEEIFSNLKILDRGVNLPLADIHDRVPFSEGSYAPVWQGTDHEVSFDVDECGNHEACVSEKYCPTDAFTKMKGIDKKKCFNCGLCVRVCLNESFEGKLGSIEIEGRKVPIGLRQSNRSMANMLSLKLKRLVLAGDFLLSVPVDRLS